MFYYSESAPGFSGDLFSAAWQCGSPVYDSTCGEPDAYCGGKKSIETLWTVPVKQCGK